MKTIEYHTADKSTWGPGPWQNEPDKMQYADPETGMPCLIVRNGSMGNLCGYVGVSEGHPYYKVDGYSFNVSVHGGITFTSMCHPGDDESRGVCHVPAEGEPDHVWWLGFDCAHYMDLSPGMEAQLAATIAATIAGHQRWPEDVYRDIDYVKAEVASLAKQLKALETP